MTDPTTILYTLSTLAQTCAALAAFVGAVGLFRLQSLRDRHKDVERELRVLAGRLTGRETDRIPMGEVFGVIEAVQRKPENKKDPNVLAAIELNGEFGTFKPRFRSSRSALFVFEGWNLFVILLSLVGFNYVERLATWKGTFWTLWVIALGTVGVTGWCMYAWTRE